MFVMAEISQLSQCLSCDTFVIGQPEEAVGWGRWRTFASYLSVQTGVDRPEDTSSNSDC